MDKYKKRVLKIKERKVRRDFKGKLRRIYRTGTDISLNPYEIFNSLIRFSNKIYSMKPKTLLFTIMKVEYRDNEGNLLKELFCIVFDIPIQDWRILLDYLFEFLEIKAGINHRLTEILNFHKKFN